MVSEPEKNASWLDDIKELIRKKKEENQALLKVQESLQSIGKVKDKSLEIPEEDDQLNDITIKNQSVNNNNNQH